MLKTELLESFVAIVESGNLSKAAEKMCRTQSALSLQIKKLEEVVGQPLFVRDNRGVSLTESGKTLLSYAHKMLQLNYKALNELRAGPTHEVIRIGIPTDYITRYLSSCLLDFIREFTFIELVIDTDVSGNLFKRLDHGEFDLIIATHWQRPDNGTLLFERCFRWVAAKDGKAHLGENLPVALYPENCPIRAQVFANHQLNMRPINLLLSTPSPEALCMAVESDIVIAPIAEFRINNRMQVLDPYDNGLPVLPIFNESLYINPACQSKSLTPLVTLIQAYVENYE